MSSFEERLAGGLWGLLVGDAVGVPYEFHAPDALPPRAALEMTPPPGFARAHASVLPGTWSDDGAHALALLATLGWGRRLRARLILGAVLLLGGVLEMLQAYVGRDAQWADMAANTLGAVVGLGLGFLLLQAARLVDARQGD